MDYELCSVDRVGSNEIARTTTRDVAVYVKYLYGANSSIQLASERTRLPQVSNKNILLLVQTDETTLPGPEVITPIGQEVPGGDPIGGGIGRGERRAIDGELDEAGADGSGGVVLEPDVLRNLNERGDDLTVELGNLGDDALEGLPEIGSAEGDICDGVSEGHGGEDLIIRDVSSFDRGAESTGVENGCVGVGSTVPLHGIGDGVTEVAFALLASRSVEKNLGPSDNLPSEFGEGNRPLPDLSLEFLVDGGGVDHMDRSASELDDAAITVKAHVESTEVFAPPVSSDNENLLAVQVLLDSRVGTLSTSEVSEGSVRVAADDEVKTLCVLSKPPVLLVADVGHGDNALGQLLIPNEVDCLLHGLGDVEDLGSGANAGDPRSSLCEGTNNGKVILFEDLVGLDVLHEVGVVALDVGANNWEGQIVQLEARVR